MEDAILEKVSEFLMKYDSGYIHKQSYDFFINHRLTKIIEEEPTITVPLGDNTFYNIHFGQVFVDKPYIIDENRHIRYIYPNEARLRDLTYSSLISVNIRTFMTEMNNKEEIIREYNIQDFYKINLARIPMMIGTTKCNLYNQTKEKKMKLGECEYDNGGYFIIKGKERVLVSQERINYNIVHVFEQKVNSKFSMTSEIRSMSEETGHSVLLQMKLTNNIEKKVVIQIPYVSQEIPLGYIFKAYNFTMDEILYIMDYNLKNEYIRYPIIKTIVKTIVRDAEMIGNQEKAISFISQYSMHNLSKDRRYYYINQILNNELLPHLGITSTKNQKGFFLGHMLSKLLFTFVKKRSLDDRDNINNKRIEAAGHLISELFRTLFKRFVRSMEPQLQKRPDILVVMSRNNMITQGIKHCFSTGNWGIPKSNYIRTGVSQILSRLTFNSYLSHLRRILIPIGKEGKNTKIRQLHASQIGYICPFETPEGHCLTADTMILCEDGITTIPIKKCIDGLVKITTVDLENGKEISTSTTEYFETMPEQLFRITLINNKSIQASGLHPFLVYTEKGDLEWKMTKNIIMSDKLAYRSFIKQISNHDFNHHLRVLGILRVFYRPNDDFFYIPEWICFKKLKMDILKFYPNSIFDLEKRIVQILDLSICPKSIFLENFEFTQGNLRDYLMGFFCGLNYGNCLLDNDMKKTMDCIYIEGTNKDKIQIWKEFMIYTSKLLNIRWQSITTLESIEFELLDKRSNIINYIDYIGYYYNSEIERNLFLYRDFLEYNNDYPSYSNIEFINNINIFHQRIVFYPLKKIENIEVELTMDFTTISKHHNFIANGFITHNSAGIVKNMTLSTQLSTKLNNTFIRIVLEEINEIDMDFEFKDKIFSGDEYYKILLDGIWIGSCVNKDVYNKLYNFKNTNRFSYFVSISINHNEREILIFTDEGRMLRPLWNAKKFPNLGELKEKSIDILIQEHKILMMDSYEIENNIIAMNPDELNNNNYYTLCEIHPSLITGLCVGLIPYSDHTQAPRITYHAAMGKQAIGMYATTNDIRADTIIHTLHYPEKPLVQTHMGMITGCNDMVFGSNLIVAVAMYTGFNQEDSVILNKSSIDRGLFRSFAFRTIHVEERKKSTTYTEDILLPNVDLRIKSYNYTKLDQQGIIKCGIFVGPSDVIVGRIQTKNIKSGGEEKIDTSIIIKSGEEGYVDRVFISTSPEGYKIVKVKIRSIKIPEIGDKVASRSAQKGTIGMVYSQEDMPFSTTTGIVPDIIINPLCLPSRMTINQIIECIASKSCAFEGKYRFGTPFTRHSTDVVDSLCLSLTKNGFSFDGKETMCNGFTGEIFQARIFMGPTYYHRLKHLVSAKIHARNHGSLQALTRQPVEGRSRDGGLRFGEMERDCMISHGVSRFLTERLFDMSDIFSVPICSDCGCMPHVFEICNVCESSNIRKVLIPYACKLLFQELMAMGIKINLFPDL